MRARYGRFQPLRLPMEIKDSASVAEAYRWVIREVLGRRISPRSVGPVMGSLKALAKLLPAEPSTERTEQMRPFDEFLELPENADLKGRYLAYLRAKVKETAAP